MITPRENLLRVFRHEKPDWIPVTGHVDPYNKPRDDGHLPPELVETLKKVKWSDESTVRVSRYLGLDIADWYRPPLKREPGAGVTMEILREGEDVTTRWHTPAGTLRQVARRLPGGSTTSLVEHAIKTAADLPAFAYLCESERITVDVERLADLQRRRAMIGEDGIILFPMPGTPLGMLVRIHAGVETTSYLCADAPEALRDLFRVMEANHRRQFELAAPMAGDGLVGIDDTSTTTISPAMFEAYCLDYTDRMAEVAHAAGKLYLHHSCGLIRDLVGLYRQTKMDAVHALQVPPIGDITIREAKKALGPRIAMIASLVQLMGSFEDWESVKRSLCDMVDGAAPGDNLILGLAPDPNKTLEETARLRAELKPLQRRYAGPQPPIQAWRSIR